MDASRVLEHVVFSADIPNLRKRRNLVKVRRGCYMEADYALSLTNSWDKGQAIAIARAASCARSWKESTIVGPVAALLHGLDSADTTWNMDLRLSGSGRGGTEMLQPVMLCDKILAPATRLTLHPATSMSRMAQEQISGINTLDLKDTIVSTVLLAPNESSFVTACEGLRRLSRFSRRALDASRAREATARIALLERLTTQTEPRSRNRRRAAWILERADGGCDSVAEELLLYHLHLSGAGSVRTQHLVSHPMGKYYLDAAVPELMLCIEFDGRIKYQGHDRDIVMLDQIEREDSLRSLGWRVIRFRWRDLQEPDRLIERIQHELARAARTVSQPAERL
ncbi:DUF559 domain-containing protein [Actinomycetaceae bacterium MB13-C1-2]|nr:DUF559 domain-containing protein [Actinomycetaceae bacterium MB13-C1-2]